VGRDRIIERERRWAVPAAIAALAPLVLYIISILIVQQAHLAGGSSDAEQLTSLHDHSGAVIFSSVLRGIGFLLLPIPILYLFRAAQARSPRVQGVMVAFVFIGPILFGGQGILQAVGASHASADFVKLPPEQTRTYAEYQKQLKSAPTQIDKVTIYTDANSLEVQRTDGTFYEVRKYPDKAEADLPGTLDDASIDNETDSDTGTGPPDAEAVHVTDGDGALTASKSLLFPAVIGLIAMMIYVPLQALRTGLLTRFAGSMGIALGASMILILPIAVLAMLAWAGYVGLVFVGKVPGGRPPAWAAAEAIPWPRPGEQPSAPRGGSAIEGEATEVNGNGASTQATGGLQKRKRKRRRDESSEGEGGSGEPPTA
jgi:hypothetical protein